MKLPTTIRIGPIVYDVSEKPRLIGADNQGGSVWLNGNIKYSESKVLIEAELGNDMKIAALWHEALHGVLYHAGQGEHPESIIIALGYGLVQLIRENPELIALTLGKPQEGN